MGQQQPNGKTKRPLLVALLVLVILGIVGAGGYAAYAHFVLGVDLIAFLRGTPDAPEPALETPRAATAPDPQAAAVVPPVVPKVVSFVREGNPHKGWGCPIPGEARASTNDQSLVKALCTEQAACKGYYSNDVGSWFIATDVDLDSCTKREKEPYPYFYKKT